jgi:cytochrome o ubiquinol oxidase subunit 2
MTLLLTMTTCVTGCTPVGLGFLDAAGPVAADQRELFFWVVGLSLVVVLPVTLLTPWLLWRYRYGQNNSVYRPKWEFSLPLEILSWGVPVLIVAVLGWLAWDRSRTLDPYRQIGAQASTLDIQVIALDWKWLFVYPQQGVATINQLVIPTGRPIHLTLTSATVMQSLAIPRLSGQIYAMSGMRTQQYLQANREGEFIGRNTQFNGAGFQEQTFTTRAVSSGAFDSWLSETRQSPLDLDCDGYRALSRYPSLHQIQVYRTVQAGLFDGVIESYQHPETAGCGALPETHRHE